jgi:MoaA/NifB/PqqE/SkfB family radical SAM enzyme
MGVAREEPFDAQLNVYNVAAMLARPRARYAFLRIDSNNTCNVQCVYCHNHRSATVVPTDALLRFLTERVITVTHVQMGCVMEPTLDERLTDLLLAVRRICPPERALIVQTNGILLHRHDHGKLADAGVTHLSVSIDSADPQVHKALRGGTSLGKVDGNVRRFREACPTAEVHFITTVTRLNLPTLEDLVLFGLDLGVSRFVLREVFYHPDNDVVDHARVPELLLRPGEYGAMVVRLQEQFGNRAAFDFADEARLAAAEQKMLADSLRAVPRSEPAAVVPRNSNPG